MRFEIKFYLPDCITGATIVLQKSEKKTIEQLERINFKFRNMETHAHHLHNAPGKKFWHYFYEFIMLFLAVFCGFLAENQREHLVEHRQEKQYIQSMIEDLQTDTANLSVVIAGFQRKEMRLDTVIRGFDENIHSFSEAWVRNFILSFRSGYPDFYHTDRTLQQLKNSGGMRLIKNEAAANGIIKYDNEIKDLEFEETFVSRAQELYIDEVHKVWSFDKMYKNAGVTSWHNNKNFTVTQNCWLPVGAIDIERLFNKLGEYNEAIIRHRKDFIVKKGEAEKLIELLKKEYHLK